MGSLLLKVEGDYGDPFSHRFFVLPSFPAGVHGIVGTDLMRKLGIELRNIPVGRDQGAYLVLLLALAIGGSHHHKEVSAGTGLGLGLEFN